MYKDIGGGSDIAYLQGFGQNVQFGKSGNDLQILGGGTALMQFVDWFTNFAVEQFYFADFNQWMDRTEVASAFGVTVPGNV